MEQTQKNIPLWALIAGIAAIAVSMMGIMNSAATLMAPKFMAINERFMPKVIEFQQQAMERVKKDIAAKVEPGKNTPNAFTSEQAVEITRRMQDMMHIPAWFRNFFVAAGVLGFLFAAFYLYSAIRLVRMKKGSDKMFLAACGIGILFGIVKAVVSVYAFSFAGIIMMAAAIAGVAINIVIFVVTLAADKSMYA
jgi:hypothetical protein